MAHFLPPEHVRQVNKLEWPKGIVKVSMIGICFIYLLNTSNGNDSLDPEFIYVKFSHGLLK